MSDFELTDDEIRLVVLYALGESRPSFREALIEWAEVNETESMPKELLYLKGLALNFIPKYDGSGTYTHFVRMQTENGVVLKVKEKAYAKEQNLLVVHNYGLSDVYNISGREGTLSDFSITLNDELNDIAAPTPAFVDYPQETTLDYQISTLIDKSNLSRLNLIKEVRQHISTTIAYDFDVETGENELSNTTKLLNIAEDVVGQTNGKSFDASRYFYALMVKASETELERIGLKRHIELPSNGEIHDRLKLPLADGTWFRMDVKLRVSGHSHMTDVKTQLEGGDGSLRPLADGYVNSFLDQAGRFIGERQRNRDKIDTVLNAYRNLSDLSFKGIFKPKRCSRIKNLAKETAVLNHNKFDLKPLCNTIKTLDEFVSVTKNNDRLFWDLRNTQYFAKSFSTMNESMYLHLVARLLEQNSWSLDRDELAEMTSGLVDFHPDINNSDRFREELLEYIKSIEFEMDEDFSVDSSVINAIQLLSQRLAMKRLETSLLDVLDVEDDLHEITQPVSSNKAMSL